MLADAQTNHDGNLARVYAETFEPSQTSGMASDTFKRDQKGNRSKKDNIKQSDITEAVDRAVKSLILSAEVGGLLKKMLVQTCSDPRPAAITIGECLEELKVACSSHVARATAEATAEVLASVDGKSSEGAPMRSHAISPEELC